MRWSFACLLGIAALAASQDSTTEAASTITATSESAAPSSTDASATSSAPITHTIGVAKGGHTFEPDVTQARIGDTIKFEFYPTNHSVIRAEYGFPCIPYEYTGVDKIGFYSGFKPVDAILDDPPAFYLTINDTDPIFFYCGAPGSCINFQMVGTINPNATTSLQNQKQLAKDSTFMLTPGESWPDEQEDPFTTTTSSSPTTTPTASSTTAPAAGASTSESTSTSHHSSLSTGAIAGIAIGAAAVALAAAVLLYLCGRQSRRQTPINQHEDRPGTGHATVHSMAYNPHTHVAGQYMDPMKHMSMHSNAMPLSPALPGYAPAYDPNMSPAMHQAYPMSDSLKPGFGSDIATLHSTSPSPLYSTPAYPNGMPHNMSPLPYGAPQSPYQQIHEMADSDANAAQGHIRRSSTHKSNGVERYS